VLLTFLLMIPEEGLNGKIENKLSVTVNDAVGTDVIPELANEPVIGTCPAVQY
jgi:hypothetical protein